MISHYDYQAFSTKQSSTLMREGVFFFQFFGFKSLANFSKFMGKNSNFYLKYKFLILLLPPVFFV
jgi:hypothetical protein